MSVKYQEFQGLNLPAIEKEILQEWTKSEAFEKSVSLREGATPFVFYEGPPSANGMPGIHHVISRTLKDLVCRYKTMQGFQVKRKGGWDTHGLPVELGVEKELGITKEDIGKKITVEEYNRKCREAVLRFKSQWDDLTRKMGYWVDLNDPYITFRNEYIETLWYLLKQLFKKGLLYKSVSIQPYSPAAGTGLSSHELNQPGTYKDVKDTSATVLFRLPNPSEGGANADHLAAKKIFEAIDASQFPLSETGGAFLMAWTTTPWTLPSNLGLTVGPNIEYSLIQSFNPYTHELQNVVIATALLHKYFKAESENADFVAYIEKLKNPPAEGSKLPPPGGGGAPWRILTTIKGKDLEGVRYEQLMPFEANSTAAVQAITPGADPFKIVVGDFVTTEDGTGIVHTAPAFGADDYKAGQKNNLGIVTLVDREGKFIDGVGEYSGRYVKNYKDDPAYVDVNVDISVDLKLKGLAFKVEKYEHSYPHCWRTDKPILYYPLDAWFIKTTALREKMVELNKTIHWKPKSTGEGRFGNWLENMVDWNLSRSRFWGTPLPVWHSFSDKPSIGEGNISSTYGFKTCVGSKADLIEHVDSSNDQFKIHYKGFYFDIKRYQEIFGNNIPEKIKEAQGLGDILKYLSVSNNYNFLETYNIIVTYSSEIDENFINNIDLHKPYIDWIGFTAKRVYANNNEANSEPDAICFRASDLIDVWFDSGAMPYAQWGLNYDKLKAGDPQPFNQPFETNFPADFICEGVDQTRGWFYTLHAIASLLYENVAFKTVVSNGLVLDKNGNKMSKRLGNVVDPFDTIDKFGADATRWYLITNASPWDNLKFDIDGIKEVQRKFFGTLYNTYQFFALYANVDGFTFKEPYMPMSERPEIDRWIISSLHSLVKNVTIAMDDYEPTQAGRLIEDFVDEHLSNWYVRLCRRRFWKGEYEADKVSAYQTLYECLETICCLMAPVAPFFSDAVYRNLNKVTGRHNVASVHHAFFPKADEALIDKSLEERMQLAQDASSLILSLRKKVNIKVRQPLQKVLIPVLSVAMKEQLQKIEELIKSEVNVKEISYLTETEGFIKKKIKPNFVALGKKLGPKMKAVSAVLAQFTQEDISRLEREGSYPLTIANEVITISTDETEITSEDIPGWTVASKGSLTVALDITVTPGLQQEGDAREFVNRIQKIRKDSGFELTDKINVVIDTNETLKSSLTTYKDYICAEILAENINFQPITNGSGIEIDINEHIVQTIVSKKG